MDSRGVQEAPSVDNRTHMPKGPGKTIAHFKRALVLSRNSLHEFPFRTELEMLTTRRIAHAVNRASELSSRLSHSGVIWNPTIFYGLVRGFGHF